MKSSVAGEPALRSGRLPASWDWPGTPSDRCGRRSKPGVEHPFSYVETSLFNGRTFSSLDHLNETTAWWLAQVADIRELREAKKTPLQLHEQERPHLVPLPAKPMTFPLWSIARSTSRAWSPTARTATRCRGDISAACCQYRSPRRN